MADVPDLGLSEVVHPNSLRHRRRPSFASQTSNRPTRNHNQLRAQTSIASIRSFAESETESEIHSPQPRRHFLLQTESQQWLHAPTLSPSGSRPISPVSLSASPSARTETMPRIPGRKHMAQSLSFGSLMEHNLRIAQQELHPRNLTKENERRKRIASGGGDVEGRGAGKRWLKWMHQNRMHELVVPSVILATTLIRWCVGLGYYSGKGVRPMFGDYEAQRHWMEITTKLPIRQWYTYDLQYWGLDYPPLTAYHSWLCGVIGSLFNPSWFALDTSRGLESVESKVFIRTTVLVSDLLVYIPAVIFFVRSWHSNRSRRSQNMALLALLLQPSLILIDSGHFQYNSVMLGFTLLALNFFSQGRDQLGAICFVASLGYKQMALYYAPAIGSYLLGKCIYLGWKDGIQHFIRLGLTTITSFTILFLPFLPPFAPVTTILDPIARIFPFARGIFEDKVANFWCASNVVFKWRTWFSQPSLIRLSAALTALGFLPGVIYLLYGAYNASGSAFQATDKGKEVKEKSRTWTLPILPWALLTSSMSFFLFSFQVHEKTILVPLLPLNLLLSGAHAGSFAFEWGVLVNNVAMFSMWPLLRKDGLALQYFAVTFLWNWTIGHNPFRWPSNKSITQYLSSAVYASISFLHLLELFITPPSRYPDLFAVLNVLVCTPVFVITWLWSIKRGMEVTWGISGLGSARSRSRSGDAKSSPDRTRRSK